jgi:hypothetical protein
MLSTVRSSPCIMLPVIAKTRSKSGDILLAAFTIPQKLPSGG